MYARGKDNYYQRKYMFGVRNEVTGLVGRCDSLLGLWSVDGWTLGYWSINTSTNVLAVSIVNKTSSPTLPRPLYKSIDDRDEYG